MLEFISGRKSQVRSFDDLFCSENLLNDETQQVLLPYLYETKLLLDEAIRNYDEKGSATIIPTFDLGFSYNIGRLAGGFTTGMVVDWQCSIPFVPIDITLKECSGSVIELKGVEDFPKRFTVERIKKALKTLQEEGFQFNFVSGNHFITLCDDSNQNHYLVVHSGDEAYRNPQTGVYPSEDVWYAPDVKTLYHPKKNRYLKYLVGPSASRFISFALSGRERVAQFHKRIAMEIFGVSEKGVESKTYQHYGLHSEHTAVLGAGLVPVGSVYPVFSKEGLPIILTRTSPDMWSLKVGGKEYQVFPHGWGQEIPGVVGINYSLDENLFHIHLGSSGIISEKADYTKKLPKTLAVIRTLNHYDELVKGNTTFESVWNSNFYGTVQNVLFPIASYRNKSEEVIYHR